LRRRDGNENETLGGGEKGGFGKTKSHLRMAHKSLTYGNKGEEIGK